MCSTTIPAGKAPSIPTLVVGEALPLSQSPLQVPSAPTRVEVITSVQDSQMEH